MSTIFYAKLCSSLARRRSSQPVQRAYWPENVIDWLGKWRPTCVMRVDTNFKGSDSRYPSGLIVILWWWPYYYAVYWLPTANSAFSFARKCNCLAGTMVIRCVMRRAWTHKFQSSGPTVYSQYCARVSTIRCVGRSVGSHFTAIYVRKFGLLLVGAK